MPTSYSIATAKNRLSRLVHEAEASGPIELTRRGQPVAMVVGLADFRRLSTDRPGLGEAIRDLRSRFDFKTLGIDPEEVFEQVEDRAPGKDFEW